MRLAVSLSLGMSQRGVKATTWLVLLCMLACTLPMPTFAPKQSHPVPFPCENCPCGCNGPEKCWTSCCCMTPAERLQWARKRGVTPPAYAILETKPSGLPVPNDAKPKGCIKCQKCVAKSIQPEQQIVSRQRSKLVLGLAAAKCAGKSFDLSSLPYFTIPVAPQLHQQLLEVSPPERPSDLQALSLTLDVPTPPPRLVCNL